MVGTYSFIFNNLLWSCFFLCRIEFIYVLHASFVASSDLWLVTRHNHSLSELRCPLFIHTHSGYEMLSRRLLNYWANENCMVGVGYPMCAAWVDARLHNPSLVGWDSILSDSKWFYQGSFQRRTGVPNCSSHVELAESNLEPADDHPNPLRKKPKVAAEWDDKTGYWKNLAEQRIAVSYKLAYFSTILKFTTPLAKHHMNMQ
jgi:hypothetical protein